MKKFIIINVLFLFTNVAYSQMAVSAPIIEGMMLKQSVENTAHQTAEIAKLAEQALNLKKTLELMEKAEKRVKQISSFVSKVASTYKLVNNQVEMISLIQKRIKFYKDSKVFGYKKLEWLTKCLYSALAQTKTNYDLINKVLTQGNMNDYERIKIIKEETEQAKLKQEKLKQIIRIYDEEAKFQLTLNVLRGLKKKK